MALLDSGHRLFCMDILFGQENGKEIQEMRDYKNDWIWVLIAVGVGGFLIFVLNFLYERQKEKASSYQYYAPGVEQFNDTLHVVHGTDTFKFRLRE